MSEQRSLCESCSYPDCLLEAVRLEQAFSDDEAPNQTQPPTYDPATILAARALYSTCYNYRQSVDIAQDILE